MEGYGTVAPFGKTTLDLRDCLGNQIKETVGRLKKWERKEFPSHVV
jgi:hypothetical protein